MKTIRKGLMLAAVCMAVQQPAAADVTFGLGFSYVFGSGPSVGAKLFSNDRPNQLAGSLGLDYRFRDKTFRPNAGFAYLKDQLYLDANLGWRTDRGEADYAVGAGWANTDEDKGPPPPPAGSELAA